ncbi:gasdermin-A-like [Diceros bicornis minor]|uniref:gasdermin-A-like n=1 Tax=Diceros bicornis minor TaxID=77932 RepID=UPI0026EAF660|nr:gasdermin-A-like [Diceros bicornis minor]
MAVAEREGAPAVPRRRAAPQLLPALSQRSSQPSQPEVTIISVEGLTAAPPVLVWSGLWRPLQARNAGPNMSSLFARDTKSLVRELGRKGELVPVDSLTSALHLRPFCLVRKKHRHHPWPWDTPLIPTDFSLMDVLEPGSPVPEVSRSKPIHVQEVVAGAVTGAMSVSTGLQGKVMGSGGVTRSSTLVVQTLRVSPHTWEMLVEKRELQSRKERENLYVVTEAVETMQDTTFQSCSEAEGAGQLSLLGLGHLKLQSQSHVAKEKTVTIPRGTVLAYRVLQLVIEGDRWGVGFGWAPGEEPDFQGLQRQEGAQLQDLATLLPELRHVLRGALQELLKDPRALQEFEDTLEQALDTGVPGQLGGPGGVILSILQDPSGSLSPSKGRAILCILGPLVGLQYPSPSSRVTRALKERRRCLSPNLSTVLSDTQCHLLAQSLERGILPRQRELVESILEPNFNQMEETTFSLPPEVLSSLQSEDAALTLGLVESCGLELQGPGTQLIWDPDVVPQLSALYGSLVGLQLLADPSPVAH